MILGGGDEAWWSVFRPEQCCKQFCRLRRSHPHNTVTQDLEEGLLPVSSTILISHGVEELLWPRFLLPSAHILALGSGSQDTSTGW